MRAVWRARSRLIVPPVRYLSQTRPARFLPGIPSPLPEAEPEGEQQKGNSGGKSNKEARREILFKAGETAAIMFSSLAMLGLAGYLYHRGYLWYTHEKMAEAFEGGDLSYETATATKAVAIDEDWVKRDQQGLLDKIVSGELIGRYYILFGEKGTGKTSMLLEAVNKVHGQHVVSMEAHADPEIFRIRLGRALNFEFFEDYLGSLFSIRGPRENSAILDIERALNVLESVALKVTKKTKKPLIFIINNAHLIRDDEEGRNLVELLQQKAEAFSGMGLVTIVFNSDDYWLYERLKRLGTRLDVISIQDFTRQQSIQALRRMRKRHFGIKTDDVVANMVYELVGGRAQHIAAVAAKPDVLKACHELIDKEKQWFLNHCALLGEDMDDDVMESGKFASAAMVLAREMVRMDPEQVPEEDIRLPKVPLWRARQIMTRPDYIQDYDNLNIFTLDAYSRVKPDSVVMMHAFREIASMPGFDELLEETLDRVSAIESLGRTREVVLKDLVDGKFQFDTSKFWIEKDDNDDHDESDEHHLMDEVDRFYWKKRLPKNLQNRRKELYKDLTKDLNAAAAHDSAIADSEQEDALKAEEKFGSPKTK